MPKIDLDRVETKSGSRYPAPHDAPCKAREWQGLGEAAGLTQFGVNTMRLAPGVWSSQRHWHTHEDEFVYMLEGEAVACHRYWPRDLARRRLRRFSGWRSGWSSSDQ